jgi:hypothetical protein
MYLISLGFIIMNLFTQAMNLKRLFYSTKESLKIHEHQIVKNKQKMGEEARQVRRMLPDFVSEELWWWTGEVISKDEKSTINHPKKNLRSVR